MNKTEKDWTMYSENDEEKLKTVKKNGFVFVLE